MSELELKSGKTFCFIDQYETLEAWIVYGKTLEGTNAFKIWVNGKPILITKIFTSVDDKLKELISRYS
jgi:hypothetical protein